MNTSDILTSISYSDIVATIAMIVAVIAVPASGYFSYRYAIKGEKRKEWNFLVEPILSELEGVRHSWNNGECREFNNIPPENIHSISRRLHGKEKENHALAWADFAQYWESIPYCPDDTELYAGGVESIDTLMQILKIR